MLDKRKNRLVTLKADARLPNNYHTAERLYLIDNHGRTFLETTGLTTFKGRKQEKLTKQEWYERGYNLVGGLRRGTNRIVTFYKHGMFVMQVQGGLHKIDFECESRNRMLFDMNRAFGAKMYKHRNGGWYVYIPNK